MITSVKYKNTALLLFGVVVLFLLEACTVIKKKDSYAVESSVEKEYVVDVDSMTVAFEDDSTHTITFHRGDIVSVSGQQKGEYSRVHVGDHYVRFPSKYLKPTASRPSSVSSGSSGSGQNIQTGPRGGKYYINSNGKKTYIKKSK